VTSAAFATDRADNADLDVIDLKKGRRNEVGRWALRLVERCCVRSGLPCVDERVNDCELNSVGFGTDHAERQHNGRSGQQNFRTQFPVSLWQIAVSLLVGWSTGGM
jgi:hypothetical protein